MIEDLDRSLENLLKRELPQELVAQITISFATPDGQFPPPSVTLPAIDLFLYDIRENRDLRDNEWRVERQSDGTAVRKAPPVRVDCSYLITAWPSDSSSTPARDEHRLLGEVMKTLLRFSMIPSDVLEGSLQGQQPPLPASTLQPGRLQSLAEFWQALGGKPKATLSYTVTIGVDTGITAEAGPLVRETVFKFRQGTGPDEV
jgi:Pvc16 N-terminal domain